MGAAVVQMMDPDARALLDAQLAGGSDVADAMTVEEVRAELDENGNGRLVATHFATTLPNLGLQARAIGQGPKRSLLVFGAAGRAGAVSMTFTLTRDDLAAINELLPLDPTREFLAGAVERQGRELERAHARIQQLEEETARLERMCEMTGRGATA